MDFHIQIDNFMANEVRASSGIFSGENSHTQWSAMSKSNTGLNLGGSNITHDCINMVSDTDSVDMWTRADIIIKPSSRPVSPE